MIISTFRDFRILIVEKHYKPRINKQLCFFNCGSFPIPSVHVFVFVKPGLILVQHIIPEILLFLLTDFQEPASSK